jgi:peptidoglycan/xylan/chitin deacetylase (PgdA/CDA1 family)
MARLACLTIDLDGLRHYAGIYGLPLEVLGPGGTDAVARLAPDRLCELLAGVGAPGTFFAIGEDLIERRQATPGGEDDEGPEPGPMSLLPGAAPLQRASKAGHEIGNHTRHHRYDLARLPVEKIAREVHGGAKAIAAVVGHRPVGFRAPGYTLSAPILAAAVEAGHTYDSSTYPAIPYYLAKASVMGWQRLRGRSSRAILDRPRVLAAPPLPYRPARDEPYAAGDLPLWELPVTTEPWTRLPLIGPTVTTLPELAFDLLYRSFRQRPFLNLELHGIDLMDASDGAGEVLPRYQPDLRIPAALKLARLRRLFARVAADYEIVTLAKVAERLDRDGVL